MVATTLFDYLPVDVVVHVREQRLDLRRGEGVFEQFLRHDRLDGFHLLQAVEFGDLCERVDVLHHIRGRHDHSVLQIQQAEGAVRLVHHGHVAVAEAAHPRDGVIEVVPLFRGVDAGRHHLLHRLRAVAPQGDAARHVFFREDAGELAFLVRREDAVCILLRHAGDDQPEILRSRNDERTGFQKVIHKAGENSRLGFHELGYPSSRRMSGNASGSRRVFED